MVDSAQYWVLCECITPLGNPVVPDVYMMYSKSSPDAVTAGSAFDIVADSATKSRANAGLVAASPTYSHDLMSVRSPRDCNSVTLAANSAPKTRTVVPESFKMNSSSSATSLQFKGTMTAPNLAIAKNAVMNSAEFICSNATRSPFFTPASTSNEATLLVSLLSSV